MKIEKLEKLFPRKTLSLAYPNSYPAKLLNPLAIKGIVLGCDPSNVSKTNKSTKELGNLFGIEGLGKDKRYFKGILKNLAQLNLSLENIYVQNLCRNYFTQITFANSIWSTAAKVWAESLKKELNDLRIPKTVPVFLTSNELYHALLGDDVKMYTPQEFYLKPGLLPIPGKDNYLERLLIPLFRSGSGTYDLVKWPKYVQKVISILEATIV